MEIDNQEVLDKISHLSIVLRMTRHEVVQAAINHYYQEKKLEIKIKNTVDDCTAAILKEFPEVTKCYTRTSPESEWEVLLCCEVDLPFNEDLMDRMFITTARVCRENECNFIQLMPTFSREE